MLEAMMASALTIKSGGTLTLKSGATLTIKDSGGGSYIVPGLEQSHWLASSASVVGGRIASIPDESGVTALTAPSVGTGPTYDASGWQSGGKTLPVAVGDANVGNTWMFGDAWATKLSNYSGAYTIAALVIPESWLYQTTYLCRVYSTTDPEQYSNAPSFYQFAGQVPYFSRRSGNGSLGNFYANYSYSADPQLWVMEYAGTGAATATGQFRFWVNGVSKSIAQDDNLPQYGTQGRGTIAVNKFEVLRGRAIKMAQFHIYKGSLTTAQRDAVTSALMTAGGLT